MSNRKKVYDNPDQSHIAKVCDKDGNEIGYVCSPIHLFRWRALSAWIAIFTVITFLVVYDLRKSREDNCRRISSKIQFTLQPDLATLKRLRDGKLTTHAKIQVPGYAYFQAHPDELVAAIHGAEFRVESFNPDQCK